MLTLRAASDCPLGHAVRLVLAEKDISVEVQFAELHPVAGDGRFEPVALVDRALVLNDPGVVMEYLDERFPHPPMMPVDPVARAASRQLRNRLVRQLVALVGDLNGANELASANARRALRDSLMQLGPACHRHRYIQSDEFGLLDCVLAPVMWRLDHYGIRLGADGSALCRYAEALFSRLSFKSSLSEAERQLRRG